MEGSWNFRPSLFEGVPIVELSGSQLGRRQRSGTHANENMIGVSNNQSNEQTRYLVL